MDKNFKYSFESWVIQCCRSTEPDLRKFLKRVLKRSGFQIKEDDFRTYRGEKYKTVHNMIATRGSPRVCLVAHTDVCRDHAEDMPSVDPIIKIEKINDELTAIIQDKNCEVQVGGDDRLGVAINTWIALNTGYDISLLFTTDEEVGLVSAEYVKFPELLKFDILLQVDRGNNSNQLVTSIGGCDLCSDKTANRLLKIAEDIGLPRYKVNGLMTDVLAITTNHMCKEAVNMTCGYHNSYGSQASEFIVIQEAKDTVKYVSSIVKYYDLEEDKNEQVKEEIDFDLEEDIEETPTSQTFTYHRENNRRGRSSLKRTNKTDLWSENSYENDKRETAYYDGDCMIRGWGGDVY